MAFAIFILLFPVWGASAATEALGLSRSLKTDAVHPKDVSFAVRQERVEKLASVERDALAAQQKAIDGLVEEEAGLLREQATLEREQLETASELKRLRGSRLFRTGQVEVRADELIASSLIYVIFAIIFGWVYGYLFTYEYPSLKQAPVVTREGFSKGLFDGFACDPDWRICVCSFCCLHARWADTVSSLKISFMPFWPGLIIFTVLACPALSRLSFGVTYLAWLILVVSARQRIRQVFQFPHGTCETYCCDCLAWLLCPCCAAMQETLEVEFVEPSGDAVKGKPGEEMVNTVEQLQSPMMSPHLTTPRDRESG